MTNTMQLTTFAIVLFSALGTATAASNSPPPDPSHTETTSSPAEPSESKDAPESSPEQKLVDHMVMRIGENQLPGGKANIRVTEGFALLDAKDAKTLLVEIYGNPPDVAEGVLGVIVPTEVSVLDDASWFAVLTYEDDGHVSDDDA